MLLQFYILILYFVSYIFYSFCNYIIIEKKSTSINSRKDPVKKLIPSKACCFERFRLNKIIVTRWVYIDKTEDGINEEKKFLRDTWGVKNLTILCSGGNLKFKYFFLLFEFFVLILI